MLPSDNGEASSAQSTPSTTPDRSQRAASPVRTLLSTYPEDERGEVGSALRNAADSLEKIGEAADKRIAEIEAELERIRAEKDSAEAELAKANAEKEDAETQTIEQQPNINLASRALIQRRCKGFGPDLAYFLVTARENIGGFTSWDKSNDQCQ